MIIFNVPEKGFWA